MRNFFLYAFAALLLVGCDDEPKAKKTEKRIEPNSNDVQAHVTTFSDEAFNDDKSLELLKELDICVLSDSLGIVAECSPKNFKLFPFKNDVPMEDAFVLEIKAGVLLKGNLDPLPPVRHIIVFERENGKLVKVNGFRGDVIVTEKGLVADHLVLGLYLKEDETLFHVRYAWSGKKYVFKSVVGLDWGEGVRTLSENTRDSVTNEIYGSIMQSNLTF